MAISKETLKRAKFGDVATGRRLAPVHPGEVLLHDFMEPMDLSAYRVARAMGVSQTRLSEILKGARSVTAETALRLERVFGMDAQTWLNLQVQYDLEQAEQSMGSRLDKEVTAIEEAA
jgi:addiction module HigA family antidote